jgi:hypothetical protein
MGVGPSNLPQNGGIMNNGPPAPPPTQRTLPIRPPDAHGFDEYDNEDFQGGQFRHNQGNYGGY